MGVRCVPICAVDPDVALVKHREIVNLRVQQNLAFCGPTLLKGLLSGDDLALFCDLGPHDVRLRCLEYVYRQRTQRSTAIDAENHLRCRKSLRRSNARIGINFAKSLAHGLFDWAALTCLAALEHSVNIYSFPGHRIASLEGINAILSCDFTVDDFWSHRVHMYRAPEDVSGRHADKS